jgi:hypothetical protein
MSEWQPIETCPLATTDDFMHRKHYLLWERWPLPFIGFPSVSGVWIDGEGDYRDPTHWMPLPEPPTQ